MVERRWKYFTDKEVEGLLLDFVDILDRARDIAGIPFIITSGYRTMDENDLLPGSAKDSAHLSGLAVDLLADNSITRFKITKALISVGLCRIGIYQTHLHVDNDLSKPQGVMWRK